MLEKWLLTEVNINYYLRRQAHELFEFWNVYTRIEVYVL